MKVKNLRKIIRFLDKNAEVKVNGLPAKVTISVNQDNDWVVNIEPEEVIGDNENK